MKNKKYWEEIPEHFDDIVLDMFVIMPNHIHGIVFLENQINGGEIRADGIHPYNGLISKIMKSCKWAVSKNGKKFFPHLPFSWQKSFHDRIIQNKREK